MTSGHSSDPTDSGRGRVAVVTGAGSGIGLAVAEALAAAGAQVAIVDSNAEAAESASARLTQLGYGSIAVTADVSRPTDVMAMRSAVVAAFGHVHILVNNAGILRRTEIEDLDWDEWDRLMAVNLKAAALCTQAVVPSMALDRWGRIINVSSDAGKSVSTLGGPHYTASKAGLLGLTRHLARTLAPTGILVNAVCPGLVDSPMSTEAVRPAEWNHIVGSLPIGRAARPAEVASLVAFLASDAASYLVGAAIDVNGGSLLA